MDGWVDGRLTGEQGISPLPLFSFHGSIQTCHLVHSSSSSLVVVVVNLFHLFSSCKERHGIRSPRHLLHELPLSCQVLDWSIFRIICGYLSRSVMIQLIDVSVLTSCWELETRRRRGSGARSRTSPASRGRLLPLALARSRGSRRTA